jgi:membrane-anchored protein YejM (alkaline phosphatase superfamily)
MTAHPVERERATLARFFLLSYLGTLGFCLPFLDETRALGTAAFLFGLAVWSTYPLVYLLPAVLSTGLVRGLAVVAGGDGSARWRRAVPRAWAVLATTAALAFLLADARVRAVYGFHVDGFVLNLVLTPGGIESMGAGAATYWTCALLVAGILALQLALLWLARRRLVAMRLRTRTLVLLWLALSAAERLGYGVAHVGAHAPVLAAGEAFPLYSRLTFDRLAMRLGFEVRREPGVAVDLAAAQLAYPRAPLDLAPPQRPLNVVWLVAESLRADALGAEIMPRTWEFAGGALRFTRHYSGGNGTRMGVFGMFYGLYGPYWFPALESRREPVLMAALRAQDYQFSLHTSARFTYPEFDSTVFAGMRSEDMHEWSEGESWERDRALVDGVVAFLDARERDRPFMVFSFFESPHARYDFPAECAVRRPYLEELNYAALDLEDDGELIRNRYLNACRHLDTQLGRLLDALAERALLDDTLVVITGDHGEEFLEHGRWGHGSTFVDEQVRVPLVLRIPGVAPAVVERMTSHLDLPATLLPILGAQNPSADLSLGLDLLGPEARAFTVVADWSRLCVITEHVKASFATKSKGLFRNELTDARDRPAAAGVQLPVEILAEVLEDLGRFRSRHP